MMDLRSFCAQYTTLLEQYKTIIFTGGVYSPLFFSLLLQRITSNRNLTHIDFAQTDVEHFKTHSSMAMLGNTSCYWLGSLDTLDLKKAKILIPFLTAYTGPHTILCYRQEIPKKSREKALIIDLPAHVNADLCMMLYGFLFDTFAQRKQVINTLFKRYGVLSLDKTCLLMQYVGLLSAAHIKEFVDEWVDSLLAPDRSLFTLSTYFFAKKPHDFFMLWQKIKNDYASPFWLSYWSDQLYRAVSFTLLAGKNNFIEAKKIGYRLPFSFIKKDWRTYKKHELAPAHDALKKLDFHIKNGGSDLLLDHWCSAFLAGHFKENTTIYTR